ncbi:hypothetical protein DERF_001259 [Dermatophagoides farinae]|uniref:Uncharacterized protein n=1 Tax=Dermatophagoides farinae TaxID=6954 RepID=A0A922L9G5_DERFA|nr:hypothetical protein DERF_001259 [Dermatophagoides farinae]
MLLTYYINMGTYQIDLLHSFFSSASSIACSIYLANMTPTIYLPTYLPTNCITIMLSYQYVPSVYSNLKADQQ